MRHLTIDQALAATERGKQIEQILGFERLPEGRAVRWLCVGKSKGRWKMSVHRCWDGGIGESIDVSEFAAVDPSEDHGEGVRQLLSTWSDVLRAVEDCGGRTDRFVNFGLLADEYVDLSHGRFTP